MRFLNSYQLGIRNKGSFKLIFKLYNLQNKSLERLNKFEQVRCRRGSGCVTVESLCDSVQDCGDASDEDPSYCLLFSSNSSFQVTKLFKY